MYTDLPLRTTTIKVLHVCIDPIQQLRAYICGGYRNMKSKAIKNTITVAVSVLLAGVIVLVTACAPNTADIGAEINSIMQNERETDSAILNDGAADAAIYGDGKYALHDDLWEYVYDPDGYIVAAIRAHDKSSVIYDATSDNQEDLDTRSLDLYQRNFGVLLKDNYSITETQTPMGPMMYEITETQNGNPTGRKASFTFSKGGAVISLVIYNKPVPEADLVKEDTVSEVQAAKIAFADVMKEYGDVLEIKEFSVAHWTAKKTTYNQKLVWKVTIDELVRTDFPTQIQGKWGVGYWIDVQTGEIVAKSEYS